MDVNLQCKQSKWQAYIDDALMLTGQVTEAAIYGVDGLKWAASKNLTVSKHFNILLVSALLLSLYQVSSLEVSKLVACITGDSAAVRKGGVKVGGETYIFLRCEEGRSIYGRKGANAGVCVVKTKQALLMGVYGSGIQPGNCNAVIEKLADYLIQHEL